MTPVAIRVGQRFAYTSRSYWSGGVHEYRIIVEVTELGVTYLKWKLVRVLEEKNRPPHDWARAAPKTGGISLDAIGKKHCTLEEMTNEKKPVHRPRGPCKRTRRQAKPVRR